MNKLQIFQNPEFGEVRVITIEDESWFVGKDVARTLGYADTNKAIAMHVDEEDKLNDKSSSSLGQRGGWVINESGLYSLILSSKLPKAKEFKRWVTSEVLPALRKTGHYEVSGYAPKATSIGEVVNLIRVTRETMKEQGCPPADIAVVVKQICDQFHVNLPRCFIKPKETTLQDAYDMVDFIFSWKGRRKPTYDDFIIQQVTTKRREKHEQNQYLRN